MCRRVWEEVVCGPTLLGVLLDERLDDSGKSIRTWLVSLADGDVELRDDTGLCGRLPGSAILTVMRRYGRPLDDGIEADGEPVDLGDGKQLRMLRFRAQVDADSRDYAVLEGDGEPMAAMARTVAAALRFLLERAAS